MNDISLPKLSVLDSEMAYREAGSRDAPVALFLHGNPTSSYIWRNIIPLVAPVAHCIAPDLIGFGQSGKPDIAYRFEDHVRYLDAFIAKSGISSAYLVVQDWGTRARLSPRRAAARISCAASRSWSSSGRSRPGRSSCEARKAREIFRKFRTPGEGETTDSRGQRFVERVLPGGMRRKLTDEEMAVYRAPFPTPQSRRPTWRFPNEMPIAGEPADVYATMERAHAALAAFDLSEASVRRRSRRARPAGSRGGIRRQAQGLPARQARRRHSFPAGGSSRDDRTVGRRLHRRGRRPQRPERGLRPGLGQWTFAPLSCGRGLGCGFSPLAAD